MPLSQLNVVHAVRPYSCLQFMTTQGLGRFPCSSRSSLVLSLEATVQYYFQFKHDENFSFCWVKLTEMLLIIISLQVSHKSISPFTKLTFLIQRTFMIMKLKFFPFQVSIRYQITLYYSQVLWPNFNCPSCLMKPLFFKSLY